jgi:ABC-type phosphate transport system substrate-binding protein
MRSFSARRRIVACALSAFAAAALAAPSIAGAEFKPAAPKHCEGANIEGKGASFQKIGQTVWSKEFNNAGLEAEGACKLNGKGEPTVKYNSVGSGPGLESWGVEGGAGKGNFSPTNNFVGTDLPPNKSQKEEIEKEGTGGKLLTIPVLQAANAILVHLPKGCTVSSKNAPGRMVMSESTVEKIFHGTLTSWTAIKDGKEKFKSKKGACNAPIKRVTRLEGSGTTAIQMKFLGVIEPGEFAVEGQGTTTWSKLAQIAKNIVWPEEKANPIIRGKGNPGVVAEVAKNESTVGYANMGDARENAAFIPPAGGPGTSTFWAMIENGSTKKGKKATITYADPATNGEEAAKARANCSETVYTDGKTKFPPASTESLWNEVTTAATQVNYPICGITYDLSLTKFSGYGAGANAATVEGSRTAFDYVSFILKGGQKLIAEGHDQEALPEASGAKVLKIAKEGLEKVSFE